MKKLLMMTALTMAVAMPAAMAKDNMSTEAKAEKWFDKMDSDNDGMITKDEMMAKAEEKFTMADKDKNGSVSEEELKQFKMEKKEKMDDRG